MHRYGLPCLLSEGILYQEHLCLSVNIKVHREIRAEDVGILSGCKQVCWELREPTDLVPHYLTRPLIDFSSTIHKATTIDKPLKHHRFVITKVHMLFSTVVEGELIREMLNNLALVHNLNELEEFELLR